MTGVSTDQLKRVIESQHGGNAAYRRSLRVIPVSKVSGDWDGIVHVYELADHPKSKRAFAWASTIKGSSRPRYFAVLQSSLVNSPGAAVMAAAMVIRAKGSRR
jgi:hypothetical protein